jgi:xanthine dehydrogenase YagT iron-sulfur-binding subunit
VDNRTSLLNLLREHFGLTGTKKACGACTVLVDGRTAAAVAAAAAFTAVAGLRIRH